MARRARPCLLAGLIAVAAAAASGSAAASASGSAAASASGSAAASVADDIDTVRSRLLFALCWAGDLDTVGTEALQYASSLLPNNTWADVDYNDYNDRSIWKTVVHLQRVNVMAQAVADVNSTHFADASLLNATRRALGFWLTTDPQNSNWWWNMIGGTQILSGIYLMLGEIPPASAQGFPTPFELEMGLTITYRASWWNASLGYEVTGANLAWMVQVQLERGAWSFAVNQSALDQGFPRLWQEVKIVNRSTDFNDAQGIQQDFSYAFHGPQLQVGSYGQDFSAEMLLAFEVAAGTQWAPTAAPAEILCKYWAEGQAWLSVGAAFEWTGVGRQCSRPGISAEYGITLSTDRLRTVAEAVCGADPAAQQGVLDWAGRIDNVSSTPALVGARSFYTLDTVVAHRTAWVGIVHSHSTRTKAPECGNGENLAGEWMGEGVLTVYSTACGNGTGGQPLGCGEEFGNIFPLFDWALVPGTFTLPDVAVPSCGPSQCCWYSSVSNQSFVGGVADGQYAAAAMNTVVRGLSARRSWFLFDNLAVGLTANASSSLPGVRAATSVAQSWAPEPFVTAGFVNGTVSQLGEGNYSLADATFFLANGVGWLPLPAAAAAAAAGGAASPVPAVPTLALNFKTGNWDSIGPSNLTASGRTLAVSLDHGAGTFAGGSWGYAIAPATNATALQALAAAGGAAGLLIGANNATVQAVADPARKVALAVFWPPTGCGEGNSPSGHCAGGSFAVGGGGGGGGFSLALAASAPGVVSYAEAADGSVATLAAANPDTPTDLPYTVTVDRVLTAGPDPTRPCDAAPGPLPGTTTVSFLLPGDYNRMGVSVVAVCAMAAG
jgi:hypothetical protein